MALALAVGVGILGVGYQKQKELNQPKVNTILPRTKRPYVPMSLYQSNAGVILPWNGVVHENYASYGIKKEMWEHPNGSRAIMRGHNPNFLRR